MHGGSVFSNTVIITTEVKIKLDSFWFGSTILQRRNKCCWRNFSSAKQVAVFDTKQTIQWRTNMRYNYLLTEIRFAFTFHGTSHKYVSKCDSLLEQNSKNKGSKIHLGNGCSMTAIKDGKVLIIRVWSNERIDYGTRSGDVDQSVIFICY
jgi:acetate kinase